MLAQGREARDARVVAAYDALATTYADHLVDELDHKPFDRWLLDRVAALAGGPVADVGTGPGHVAARLAAAGAAVTGVDLSPEMVAEARRRFPDLAFEVGDLTALLRPPTAAGWGAITAWYALVHVAPSELGPAVGSLARVLAPGGWLALALHTGTEVRHADELWDQPVDVDFVLHDAATVLAAVRGAGLTDVEWYLRSPLPEVEVETERLYVLARRAGEQVAGRGVRRHRAGRGRATAPGGRGSRRPRRRPRAACGPRRACLMLLGHVTLWGNGGQGRGRTADLPIFSRTLVPTELPGRAARDRGPAGGAHHTGAICAPRNRCRGRAAKGFGRPSARVLC